MRDSDGAPTCFAVDRYFDRVAWHDRITGAALQRAGGKAAPPLQDYIGAVLRTGLALRDFHEATASDEDAERFRRFRYLQRIPYFLFMRWQKP